jgi:circadian clock protein KaiC
VILEDQLPALQRLSTGSSALDRILGGGVPQGSVVAITGEPGSGKTILTLQVLFRLAREGRKALYFTTLSEPAIKLIRYMQAFAFFDPSVLEDQIIFVDLGASLRERGAEGLLGEVADRVEREEPDVVAIDSFKAIHDLLDEATKVRAFVYDLAVQLASWDVTSLLVGEYTREEITDKPEFAIADGILQLTNERVDVTAVRQLEVLKLRGADYTPGRHFFEIGGGGLTFYPRVQVPELTATASATVMERVSTGIDGLDELLGGGLPRASSTVVEGGTGTGKTMLALRYLLEGAHRGDPGVLFTLEETPQQLREIAQRFGWDVPALEERGLLSLCYVSPIELVADRFLANVRERLEATGARRAVLDSLTSLELGVFSEQRFKELVYALTKHARALDVTLMMTLEANEQLGAGSLGGRGVSPSSDNVVLLRYVELDARVTRAIAVLKMRGASHSAEVRQWVIDAQGLRVGPPFRHLRGVLTGIPQPSDTALAPPVPQQDGEE